MKSRKPICLMVSIMLAFTYVTFVFADTETRSKVTIDNDVEMCSDNSIDEKNDYKIVNGGVLLGNANKGIEISCEKAPEMRDAIMKAFSNGECKVWDIKGNDITDYIASNTSENKTGDSKKWMDKAVELGGVHFSAHVVKGYEPETLYMQYYEAYYNSYTGTTGAVNNKTWGIIVYASGTYELHPNDADFYLHNFSTPGYSYEGRDVGAWFNLTSVTIYPYSVYFNTAHTIAYFNAYVTHSIQYIPAGVLLSTYGPFSATYYYSVQAQ